MQKMDKVRFYPTCKPYIALLGQRTANCALLKLIGVQSNHGVEYLGGPAAPTLRFPHNQHSNLMAWACWENCFRTERFRTNLVREVFCLRPSSITFFCKQKEIQKFRYDQCGLVHDKLKLGLAKCLLFRYVLSA